MNKYEEEKLNWYREIFNKPTLWYKLPSEYIDYQDSNFWKVFYFVIERLNIDLKTAYEQIDAINNLSKIPLEYREKNLCLLAFTANPATTLKYIPDEFKTEEICQIAFLANPKSNFKYIPDTFKTEEMCIEAFNANPKNYKFIPEIYRKKYMQETIAKKSINKNLT